jgi:hypothetical protein
MLRKIFSTVKNGILLGTFTFSLIIAFVPITSAGIIDVPTMINVSYPTLEENVIPNGEALTIPLETTFTLTGRWASYAENSRIGKSVVQIELKVVEKPDWCTASISNPLANIAYGEEEPYKSFLTVTVNENAPAFQQGVVKISATSVSKRGLLFNIIGNTTEFHISFIIGYLSDVVYELPKGTFAEIKTSEKIDFPIEIKNFGNGPTFVDIEIMDYPEKIWDVDITSSVQLSSGNYESEDSTKTVFLKIKPKKSSDWKNDRETFRLKFTPSYLGRPGLQGQQEIINFNVQKNDSEEGSVNKFLIILILGIILIILISIILKRRFLQYSD